MAALADRAFAYTRAPQVDLSGPLGGVQDWYIVDSTTVTVRDARIEECPGTGSMRRSRSIQSSPLVAVHRCATIVVPPVSMPANICRSTSPGRATGLLTDLA